MALSFQVIIYSLLAGIVPALVWLYFLLQEDRRCPEPPILVFIAFLAGMFAVPIVIPLESFAAHTLQGGLPVLLAWATAEETVKYVLAAVFILWRREAQNPIDIVITMFTVALGFAALENTFFLISPFAHGNIATGLITDNLRFVGSTLLHVIASSAIGFTLAFTYQKSQLVRALSASAGLILAIALHTLFNFFIIGKNGGGTILAFFVVWTGAIVFFALFEVLKYFRYHNLPANTC